MRTSESFVVNWKYNWKLKILKAKLENLKKIKNFPILSLNFNFISVSKFWF